MITQKQLSAVLHHSVYDSGGQKIGEARDVFYDDVTGQPDWVAIKTGMLGGSASFVPIQDAVVAQGRLKVPYSKNKIKAAPHVEVDAKGHLSAQEEHRLYDFYGIDWQGAMRRSGGQQPTREQATARQTAAGGTAAAAAGTAAAGTAAADQRSASRPATAGQQASARPVATGQRVGQPQAGMAAGTAAGTAAGKADAATERTMTRSEESMHVGVERHESGRARLHKYVVTEEQEQTVPLRHEEVRLVREPLTDANLGEGASRPEIAEAEQSVTLHEDKPVVETTVEAKERVRLVVDERTEQATVRGRVRKEQIRLEGSEGMEGMEGTKGDAGAGGGGRDRRSP